MVSFPSAWNLTAFFIIYFFQLCVIFDSSHVAKVWKQLLHVGALVKVNIFASRQHATKFVHILREGYISQSICVCSRRRKSLTDDSKLAGGVNLSIN